MPLWKASRTEQKNSPKFFGYFPPIIVSQLHCSQQGAHKGLVSLLYIYIYIAPPGGEEGEARGAIYLLYDVKVCMYINSIYIYVYIYTYI